MPHSDFLAWLSSATLGFFSLAEQCNTRIFYLGWAVPHSDVLAWLSSVTLVFFAWLSSATLGFFSLAEQCHIRISHLGWAEPHFDFLAWLSSATLWFYSLAEKCHTQIFCFGWKLPYLDILACLSSATFGYFRLAKHGPLCALHGLLQWLQFLPLFILASSFSNLFSTPQFLPFIHISVISICTSQPFTIQQLSSDLVFFF